jgi:hypothetical protein
MSFKKFTTSAAVIAALLATSLSPLATAANAAPRWQKHNDHSYSRHYNDGPRYRYVKRHRHNDGKNIATGIAIGLGVLAVGSILASQAHR